MVDEFFHLCAEVASSAGTHDKRSFLLGAVAVRSDGAIVRSPNGAAFSTAGHKEFRILPSSHAECRALKKAGSGSILFVARLLKLNDTFALARPCWLCRIHLAAYKTKLVYYTINEHLYGTWNPATGEDKQFEWKGHNLERGA